MIRLRSLTLTNFKNVKLGTIKLSDAMCLEDFGNGADVVGIYGQNGSGKTSFIHALAIIKQLMRGDSLSPVVREYISSGSSTTTLTLEFFMAFGEDQMIADYVRGTIDEDPSIDTCIAEYRVCIGSCSGRSPLVISESLRFKSLSKGESFHEVLSWCAEDDVNVQESSPSSILGFSSVVPSWVDNSNDDWAYSLSELSPSTHWRSIGSVAKSFSSRIEVARRKAFEERRSLLFSDDFIRFVISAVNGINGESLSRAALDALGRVLVPVMQVSATCSQYALKNMAVLTTSHQGMLALNYLPLAIHEGERKEYSDNSLLIDIEKIGAFPVRHVDALERALANINGVIDAVVPGLKIGVARLGKRAGKDGETLEDVELMSQRGDSCTPLRNESEGIKKILSIVSLLVDVHTNPLTFLAIDEFDSGVFEYLLGEMLSAIAEHGMGQLVFTAHNLRPLEVLDSKNIWFTKTDAKDRYVVSKGVRGSNNLRKMYLRNIRLGADDEEIYLSTSPLEIDSALFDAGMAIRDMQSSIVDGEQNA